VLVRQKAVLALLSQVGEPLSRVFFVKLMFLLRHETELKEDRTFYDFVPYKYGPFSFTLYRELSSLRRDGYVAPNEERISLGRQTIGLAKEKIDGLPVTVCRAVDRVVGRYGGMSQSDLVRDVYARYPWYASRSELPGVRPSSPVCHREASPAVYTAGYQGTSVDAFFNSLLTEGIRLVIDVRANPVSRRYGFSKGQFSEIAMRLGLGYRHIPNLGIPSRCRVNLSDFDSYQRLLKMYEEEILPQHEDEIDAVGALMEETPAVLVCFERDVCCCHRSRLAVSLSRKTGLGVKHI